MRDVILDENASEASGLLAIENRAVLEAQGWRLGFWTCSDEGPVEKALRALGKREGSGEWELCRVAGARATVRKKTEDCEGIARQGKWVYVFGSHFGTKTGPLEPRRHFVARFNEAKIDGKLDDVEIPVEIAKGAFKLHRLINDALKASGLAIIETGAEEARQCIEKTRKAGKKKGKRWAGRIHKGDWPVNIEGVAFRDSGTALLGLRYPVTHDGHPLIVELDDISKLFRDPSDTPSILHLWVLDNVGSAREPRGLRALEIKDGVFHAITGSLDSDPEESVLLQDHPEGERAESEHHRFTLPEISRWTGLRAQTVTGVDVDSRVEGLAVDGEGRFRYVLDDDRIHLRSA
ncbi:MAG TPA: DUF3616 domain-containing protein [Thermoanaerobaculia bacterium]|nr:DUF3616 domain-containing protein [Thermoanaerobaculia bacterium]